MKNGKRRMRQLLAVLAICGIGGLSALPMGRATAAQPVSDKQRADIVTIDAMKAYGKLSQPTVAFLHDKHTTALGKQKDFYKKECGTCHLSDKDGVMQLGYMSQGKPVSGEKLRDNYHNNCISCHKDMAAAGQKTGPTDVQCKGCHNATPDVASNWQPLVVDKRLHYRHAATQEKADNKCGACHHIFSEKTGKTVPAPKPEEVPGSCSYCHGETTTVVENRQPKEIRSLRLAAHGECVTCHKAAAAAGKDVPTGPVTCAGCHGPLDQKAIAETSLKKVPQGADLRIKRGQPDYVMVRPAAVQTSMATPGKPYAGMPAVPFDHKYHEAKSETCVSCHHAALSSCSAKCHTPAGVKEGGFVTLEGAMHNVGATQSCAGCHAVAQKKPECAGCHDPMPKGIGGVDKCGSCHVPGDAALQEAMTSMMAKPASADTAAAEADLAKKLLAGKRDVTTTFPVEDIPQTVTIGSLSKDYEPSVLPHRQIVQAMLDGMKDSKLAGAFHATDAAVCQGCHHNSPASKTPPRCGNCHQAVETTTASARPALKAAYHNQCMGCHKAMGIEGKVVSKAPGAKPVPAATDCAGCHKEKKQ
ncbi:sulfate respiration complex hexadecaheme cytochrome HmcA [Solidesulfovibrio carbinolicus]|uniref:Choline transporter n=1 Tax=Solidesulfovibrio carbinolicus TaxID=296842 RepID=A0A4P6HMV8_9BACT|nr:choline transporter [Solidesulfovibrio carbinolicus]